LGTSSASSRPRRKAVTAFNDDGRVPWGELSGKEKAARATQQTFNFSFIIVGAILTVSLGEKGSLDVANNV
jgi:import inner membrane translocase subunit TIM21